MPRTGVEPARLSALDSKSSVSANSTTWAKNSREYEWTRTISNGFDPHRAATTLRIKQCSFSVYVLDHSLILEQCHVSAILKHLEGIEPSSLPLQGSVIATIPQMQV